MSLLHRALFQKLEGQYYHFKHGYVEPQLWPSRLGWARGVLALPMIRDWRDEELKSSVFSSEFASIISESPASKVDVKLAGLREPHE